MGAASPAAYFWLTEAPRKVSRHSESGGRSGPAPPPKAIAHPFFGHFCGGRTWARDLRALIFGRSCARCLFLAHGGSSQSLVPFRVRWTNLASPSPQGYSPPAFWAFLQRKNLGTGRSGAYFLGAAVPAAYFWHTEAPRKVWPHSESGGRTWPTPPPKAIAHPFFGHFYCGRTWGRDLRVLIFGLGSAHGLFLTHGGPLQSLAPFRRRRMNLASPSPHGYRPPVFWAFLRRTN